MDLINILPKELIQFVLVVVFSLLFGLEQRRMHNELESELLFGTDRTITLIGILGFILYYIMPVSMGLFIGGGIILSALLGIYYFNRIRIANKWGFTTITIALITYCMTPIVVLMPLWLTLLVVVTILVVVEMKESLFNFSRKFDRNEFTQLAKFLLIAGIILPLLPNENISALISVSPYQIWVSIVAVSGISYLSYLLRKFVFPDSGIMISAILGGLYSSTATTLILARKSKEENNPVKIASGILGATGMMYLRIIILAEIFNPVLAAKLLPWFIILIVINILIVLYFIFMNRNKQTHHSQVTTSQNPLEFKTALVFGLLFTFFGILTHFVVTQYGNTGVNILSFIVGITDIDPYLLNLFQNPSNQLTVNNIIQATLIATTSNNLIKMIYALILGDKSIRKIIITGFSVLIVAGIIAIVVV
jgi:uncharacterized membrane protein (DUF4010 family)